MNHDHLTPADARWQQLADADLCGEPLTAGDREFLATHVSADPSVRAEQQLRLALARPLADDPLDAGADERLISALVDRHLAAPPLAPVTPIAARRPAVWLAAGLLLAAGLAFVWLRPPPAPPRPDPIALLSGAARLGELAAVPGDSLPTDRELTTQAQPACLGAPGRVKACLAPHSRARLADDGALELLDGAATVEVSAALPVTQFILQVAGVRITSRDGDFAVSVRTGTWTAAATRGHAEVHDATGLLARLGPGDRLSRGDAPPLPSDPTLAAPPVPADIPAATATAPVPTDSPPVPADSPAIAAPPVPEDSPESTSPSKPASKPSPPAAELLAQAREHRAAGRVRDALKAYQRLVAAHPDSPLAGTAQLAIGQLYLGPASDPAAALRAFDAYLVHPGPLAEEAAHGRISALLRLGRDDDATAAIDRFLARYPASSYADALRRQSAP